MADKGDKADTADGEKKGKVLPIVLIVLGAVLLAAASTGATMYLMSSRLVDNAPADGVSEEEEVQPANLGPPIYFGLDPAMVVNFQNPGPVRFLQVKVQVMAREKKVIEAVKEHMPAIRNDLMMLFSSQRYETIKTREGKDALRQEVLGEIQEILTEQTGEAGVEQVYFTSFVMQ
jgi:flagellar FliL protein